MPKIIETDTKLHDKAGRNLLYLSVLAGCFIWGGVILIGVIIYHTGLPVTPASPKVIPLGIMVVVGICMNVFVALSDVYLDSVQGTQKLLQNIDKEHSELSRVSGLILTHMQFKQLTSKESKELSSSLQDELKIVALRVREVHDMNMLFLDQVRMMVEEFKLETASNFAENKTQTEVIEMKFLLQELLEVVKNPVRRVE